MQIIQADAAQGVAQVAERLTSALSPYKMVVWIVPGGSNIPLAVEVMKLIPSDASARLTILLTDERFGPVGHPDSNYLQLTQAGFMPKNARFVPVLSGDGSLEHTTTQFAAIAQDVLQSADEVIAQFGMGADGHIAGILPYSDAAKSTEYAASYETETYTRVTLTFDALRHIDTAFAFVYGSEKHDALQKLRDRTVPLIEQPAQILKELTESYVYNDQIGENE